MKKNHYADCIDNLKELKKQNPAGTLAQHLFTILSDEGNFWGLTDKELLTKIRQYKDENSLDKTDLDVDAIIKDGENLFKQPTLEEEEDEDAY